MNDPSLFRQVRQLYSDRVCNAQELAGLLFERYDTGLPIAIVRVKNAPRPTYLLTLQGTELQSGYQATNLLEGFLEGKLMVSSDYQNAVIDALRKYDQQYGLHDSDLIIAAHSLGGIVSQNLIAQGDLASYRVRLLRIIDFGAPGTRREMLSPNVALLKQATIRFEARDDVVLNTLKGALSVKYGAVQPVGSCSGPGLGTRDPLFGDHNNYPFCPDLANYDALGKPHPEGRTCLLIDRNSLRAFDAPNQRSRLAGSSEEIGEAGMDRMAAAQLGYYPLLSPGHTVYPNGYDGVYWDPNTCALVIGEAKGGYNGQGLCAILGNGYGFRQGSIGWALGAAARVYRSRTVRDDELTWALVVYQTICNLSASGRLASPINPNLCRQGRTGVAPPNVAIRVEVFHTENRTGRPGRTTHYVTDKSAGCAQKFNCECR